MKTARDNGEIQSKMSDKKIAGCFIYLSEGIGTRFTLEGRGINAGEELIQPWDSFYNGIKCNKLS